MEPTLKSILLVDDDEATNFLHKKVISTQGITKECHVAETGLEALKYLTTKINGKYPKPDLIFLDINMPVMNGWQFLKEYGQLDEKQKADVVLVMLTTSLNPDDEQRGNSIPDVSNFMKKPLTKSKLGTIMLEHFVRSTG